jgi:hypothetical protein
MQSENSQDLFSQIVSHASCSDCSNDFNISRWESNFLEKIDLPLPRRCPRCRSRRRLLHLNQIHLNKRTCDATNKLIFSHFSEKVVHPVYAPEYWHSDAYDGRAFGRDFDFSKPFFEQFRSLKDSVPFPALHLDYANSENSSYVNYAGKLKNCYFLFNSNNDVDCLYGYGVDDSQSCLDGLRVGHSELCYAAVDCLRCYRCAHISQCEGCTDSYFMRNCVSCRNCFMCVNLRHKEFHVKNKPVKPEVFAELIAQLKSYSSVLAYQAEHELFRRTFPERFLHGVRTENVRGNYLVECHNAFCCFDSHDLWDGMYASQAFAPLRDFLDCNECGAGELMCNSANSGDGSNLRCCFGVYPQVHDLDYCIFCVSGCANLFGCIGLKRNEYCILNKQYRQDEYAALVPKIIAHMKATGEWGEFFPPALSDFPYNLTQAQVHHPLTREQALALGFQWQDDTAPQTRDASATMPDGLADTSDEILKNTLACGSCGRGYRIQKLELRLHREIGVALPRHCFLCRHQSRCLSRTPREIFSRLCDRCAVSIETAYPPTHPQQIYCEACFADALE